MATVDVRGLACPAPLIKTKQAIGKAGAGTAIQIIGDGEIPLGNLKNYLRELGIAYKEMHVDNQEWILVFSVPENGGKKAESVTAKDFCRVPDAVPASAAATVPVPVSSSYTIAVSSLCMGKGDPALGSLLMKSFLNVLPELDSFPKTICFYNEGVRLACKNSPVLDSLQNLQEKGVELVVCGTCIEFYGLKEDLAVGKISNMYHIATLLSQSAKVIYP